MKPFPVIILAAVLLVGAPGRSGATTLTTLYAFGGTNGDGGTPEAGLVQDGDGNFYGTTVGGGANGYGTVFRISPSGSYTSLYSFVGPPNDGRQPSGLVLGSDGNFYGTISAGDENGNSMFFRITPAGNFTSLYSFGSPPSGLLTPA
jgi:uncharacterized repeat protein (TIGR03803 family)